MTEMEKLSSFIPHNKAGTSEPSSGKERVLCGRVSRCHMFSRQSPPLTPCQSGAGTELASLITKPA